MALLLKCGPLRSWGSVGLALSAFAYLGAAFACGPTPPEMTLLDAIAEGRADVVRDHMEAGSDPNKTFIPPGVPAAGASALHLAVIKNDREITKVLLDNGADIDLKAEDTFEGTPLEWAAFYGIRDMVEYLVTAGADMNAKNAFGTTPLDAAYADNPFIPENDLARFNDDRNFIREYLSQAGGNRSIPKLTLLEAIDQEDPDAVRGALASGADPNEVFIPPGLPAAGASALHLAVLKDSREIVELLLEHGADIDLRARDAAQGSPLEWAAFFGIRDMVEFLVDAGADPNAKNAYGTTPLDAASADNPFIPEEDMAQFNADRAFIAEYLTSNGAESGQ